MKYSINLLKPKARTSLTFERRLAFTLLGLFALIFVISMVSIKYTNTKLNTAFGEIESRNLLAAKKTLEQDLLSWKSSLSLIAYSGMVTELFEYNQYGLVHEENKVFTNLQKYFFEAEKSGSGITNVHVAFHVCESEYKISGDKHHIEICVNNPNHPISVIGHAPLNLINRNIHEFMPNAEINLDSSLKSNLSPLSIAPKIAFKINKAIAYSSLIDSVSLIVPISLAILFIGVLAVLFFFWSKLLRAQSNVLNYIGRLVQGQKTTSPAPQNLGFTDLESTMKNVVNKIIAFEKNKKEEELLNLSKQISHDIRSPLTALNLLSSSLTELPEEKRILIRNSINRINDIANSLLDKGRSQTQDPLLRNKLSKDKNQPLVDECVMVSSLIDSIVSEKRIQFRELPQIQIESKMDKSYGLFIRANGQELKRVLSNLINNAVEACTDEKGEVTITTSHADSQVEILIKDNGCGIPDAVLKLVGQKGFSYGKSNSAESGSGLGVYHARKTIEAFGGEFEIDSRQGIGTRIIIRIPRVPAPPWFVEKLLLRAHENLVICDDDTSIHQIWLGRLKSLNLADKLNILSFSSGPAFAQWITQNKTEPFICLVDYELLDQPQTGLDLIESLQIESQSILVTSRYEEQFIKNRCSKMGVKLIPKDVAGYIPIQIAAEKMRYEACLIDDDPIVRTTWDLTAKDLQIPFLSFASKEDFIEHQDEIAADTPLYIDIHLGTEVDGRAVAHELFNEGFSNISMTTGYNKEELEDIPPFIQKVLGKEPPFVTRVDSEPLQTDSP